MRNMAIIALIIICVTVTSFSYAEQKSSTNILKEGILGAGAGAVGGAASGAKSKELWKGALAGAGVNVVGGAILDSMTGEKVTTVNRVETMPPQDAYSRGYEIGYSNGYKQAYSEGYTQGYKDGIKDGMAMKNR